MYFISSSAIYKLIQPWAHPLLCFNLLIYKMSMKILNRLLGLLECIFIVLRTFNMKSTLLTHF